MFYNLVAHPKVAKKLQQEIDTVFEDESNIVYEKMRRMDYLQAVINETLRLFPAVPSGLERITPPGGLQISGVYVPSDVVISVPQWTVHRGNTHRAQLSIQPRLTYFIINRRTQFCRA